MRSVPVRRAAALAGLAALAACATDQTVAPVPSALLLPDNSSLAVSEGTPTGTYLVWARGGGGPSTMSTSIAAMGGTIKREISAFNLYYVDGLGAAGAASLASQPGVSVIPDRLVQFTPHPGTVAHHFVQASGGPVAAGTDQSGAQFFNQYQWYLRLVNAHTTWVPSNGGSGETVCVLDSGIDPGHLDLNGTVDPTRMVTVILNPRFPSDLTPLDHDFHGTFVSALIRSNGIGMASVAPNATLCSIKVLSEDGAGTFGDIIFGIYLAAQFRADVINMSLGGYIQETNPANAPLLELLQEVITGARTRGSLVVAASGNDGFNMDDIRELLGFITVPAQMNHVISVAATGPINQQNFDQRAAYSNFGGKSAGDLVAPGGNGGRPGGVTADYIISACSRFAFGGACASGTVYLFANGTSFAAPIVSGAGAVVESNVGSMSTGQLETCILSTARWLYPGWIYGKGQLDVRNASLCTGK